MFLFKFVSAFLCHLHLFASFSYGTLFASGIYGQFLLHIITFQVLTLLSVLEVDFAVISGIINVHIFSFSLHMY